MSDLKSRMAQYLDKAEQPGSPAMGSPETKRSAAIGSPKFSGGTNKCTSCEKTVYPMEQITVDAKQYHKACFKCTHCGKILSPGTYASLDGKTYCKPHFKQLFALKGNYNEGFGTEQHKNKWDRGSNEKLNGSTGKLSKSLGELSGRTAEPQHAPPPELSPN